MSELRKKIFLIFANLLVVVSYAFSQCAMCKASAETNAGAGETQAHGINTAVFYVLAISFIFIGALIYVVWKLRNADELNS